jgi:glycosyltransferase involved in cell wall biosynthesis
MGPTHSSHTDAPPKELLAVSFAFPPLAYPRSGQVARLLKHLRLSTTLVCADERGARRDPTLEPDAEKSLRACLRVPFPTRGWRSRADNVASRLRLPVWGKIPDLYASWKPAALKALKDFTAAQRYQPDAMVTFGQPMSDHLIGLELKRLYRVPWAAHFSDPWVDNPFHHYDALARKINLSLERRVMERADMLVFTSQETVELMLAKYPAAWKAKARVLPHSFDPALYPPATESDRAAVIVRYTGELYGRRTPRPLVETLRSILSETPQLLAGVRFELIGAVAPPTLIDSGLENLPEGLVVIKPPVSYQESLALGAEADGLLIIDAPAERSVFLPSKLIDYIGAGRPILGLTPPGAAADLITQLGGWAADPADTAAMREATAAFLSFISRNESRWRPAWGTPEVRKNYEAHAVAQLFEGQLRELMA